MICRANYPRRARKLAFLVTIEEGIERSSRGGCYIATVTHQGVRHREYGLKTLEAAQAWRTAKKAELLGDSEAGTPARQLNEKGARA